MRRRTLILVAVVLIIVLLAGAYFGGLLGITGPPGSVRAWSYEQGSSALTPVYFTAAGLTQDFVATTTVGNTTSVYIDVEVDGSKFGPAQYNFVWAIHCNGGFDNGGTGGATWDTTKVVSEWFAMPMNNPGNISAGDACTLFVHGVPLTSGHTISEVGWIAGGTVQDCPSCPAVRTKNTIVWGTPPAAATPKLVISSITSTVTNLTAKFSANVSGGTTPYTYLWQFGDGTNSTLVSPTHTYAHSGTYTTYLTVKDTSSQTAQQSRNVAVTGGTTPPQTTTTTYTTELLSTTTLVIIAAIVIAGVVVILIGRRRRWF